MSNVNKEIFIGIARITTIAEFEMSCAVTQEKSASK
jgi:hypothetical protein